MARSKLIACTMAIFFSLFLIESPCMAGGGWDSYKLTQTEISKIEAKVVELPEGRSIKNYNRYYAGRLERGLYIVTAVYISGINGRAIIVPYGELPLVLDGGCDVIKIKYNLAEKSIISIRCNGSA